MKHKEEVLYDFAKRRYDESVKSGENIRSRSLALFSIITTVITAFTGYVFSEPNFDFNCLKIVLIVLASLSYLGGFYFFLYIYKPSTRLATDPDMYLDNIINIPKNLEQNPNNDKSIDDRSYIKALLNTANAYLRDSKIINENNTEKGNRFISMSSLLLFSLVLLILVVII